MTHRIVLILPWVLVPLIVCAFLTGWTVRFAATLRLVDIPNQRSSHTNPTPRGGGLAIVVTTLIAWLLLMLHDWLPFKVFLALAGGGTIVASVGFLDDRWTLGAGIRLIAHAMAALWASVCLGGLPAIHLGDRVVELGALGHAVNVLGIVWVLNLFNFMDGIDGIAACETAFVTWGAALFAFVTDSHGGVMMAAVVLGAAALGFLWWNWPPAKVFMGDVGSGYIGYALAVIGIASAQDGSGSLLVWWMLGGVFVVDASVTLLRRIARGEKPHEAHRSHAYQSLSRRWNSHKRVTLLTLLLNLFWLLPLSLLVAVYPQSEVLITCAALVPLVGLALIAGAGRSEMSRG